jgi:glutamate 5-kinase
MDKPVIVIKIGSSVIADASGKIDPYLIKKIAAEISGLKRTYRVILVSSGAVSSGSGYLRSYKGKLIERKAAAAIGNPILIEQYGKCFSMYNIQVAQALLERHHFSNRDQFLQLKETISELWKNDILTIVNENDFVSNHELKFSDNDELATLIAIAFNADALLLCTTAGGFRDDQDRIISKVEKIDTELLAFLKNERSSFGTGGMASKLAFTRLATSLGIRVVICGINGADAFTKALEGTEGTSFQAKVSSLRDRQKWLSSGSVTIGSIQIDEGAVTALTERKNLLSIGIMQIQRPFSKGEVVQLVDIKGRIAGVAKMKMGASEIGAGGAMRNTVAARANDIVMF